MPCCLNFKDGLSQNHLDQRREGIYSCHGEGAKQAGPSLCGSESHGSNAWRDDQDAGGMGEPS